MTATLAPPVVVVVPPPPSARAQGPAGTKLIQKWEGCDKLQHDGRFAAYPDPGSRDGNPWTIGWGSTGSDIKTGSIWTQAECDARFTQDMRHYADAVAHKLGDAPTAANQFDALVSFHYNTGAIATAGLTRKHIKGDFAGAAKEFARWIYNDGKPMQGLKNRRAEEAALYAKP